MSISIIIPVYRVEDYLPGCVASVLANELQDEEIILVDDGSPDGCPALCDAYAAQYPERIRVIHRPNGGLGAARNSGIEAARGDWLLFLDGDDQLAPEALSCLRRAVQTPGTQIVGFGFDSDDGAGRLSPGDPGFPPAAEPFSLDQRPAYLLALPSAPLRLWDRRLFLESGVRFPSRVWYEDIRTTVKLLPLAAGITVLPDRLYRYLQRPGSIMSNQNLDRNREILDAFDDILDWYRRKGLFERYRRELCELTVEHVLLAASVRVARADPKHPLLKEFRRYTDSAFPDWTGEPYLKRLSGPKTLALTLIRGGHYRLLSLLFRLKG